jgi:hypothetical protein
MNRKWTVEDGKSVSSTEGPTEPTSPAEKLESRVALLEAQLASAVDVFSLDGGDTGNGSLLHTDPPVLGRDRRPRVKWALWAVKNTLTCQTSMGRNLKIRNFSLKIWDDGRWHYVGDWANESRHAGWIVSSSMIFRYNTGEPFGKKGLVFKKNYYIVHGKVHKGVNASGSEVWIGDHFAELTRIRKDQKELRFYISGMDWPD